MQIQPLMLRLKKGRIKEIIFRSYDAIRLGAVRRNRSIRISEILERLDVFSDAVKAQCKKSEPDFIKLGNNLQQIDSNTASLTELTIRSLGLINAETGLLSRISAIAGESGSELQIRYTNVMNNLEKVSNIVHHLSSLYELCRVIEKIAVFLRIIGLNVDIESSRSAEAGEMFGFVAKEMRRLSDTVVGISAKMRDNSDEAKNKQLAAHLEISGGISQLKTFSDTAERTTQNAVAEIGLFIHQIYQILDKARDHSEIVSSQVTEIVLGIQLHDSMNQRMDHIVNALQDVKSQIEVSTQNRTEKIDADAVGAAYAIIHLQSEQLRHIIGEIEQVYEKNIFSFDRIRDEAVILADCLAALVTEHHAVRHAGDPFAFLKNTLTHLHDLLEQGRSLITKIEETTNHASKGTSQLSDLMNHLRSFSFNTHLIALNAIVKAAQIGETGATLEVLSQEMSKLSIQTNEFVETVEKILSDINTAAEELNSMNLKAREISPVGKARVRLESGLTDIFDVYSQFRNNVSDVLNQSETIQSFVSTIRSSLSFMPEMANALKDHLHFLEDTGNSLSQWATRHAGLSQIEFGKVAERYTMQKERDIHQKVLETNKNSAEGVPESVSGSKKLSLGGDGKITDKDSLGDNVELF